MTTPYDELAAHLQASTSSQPAKEWFRSFATLIKNWPTTSSPPQYFVGLNIKSPEAPQSDILPFTTIPQAPAPPPPAQPASQALAMQVFLGAAAKDPREARAETRRRADRAFTGSLGL